MFAGFRKPAGFAYLDGEGTEKDTVWVLEGKNIETGEGPKICRPGTL